MASADSLEAMMTHIQTMEDAMVSVLMEAIMKQSAVVDATILIVVDGPRGRKWAGRNHLRDAYLEGMLTSVEDENEIVVDPMTTDSELEGGGGNDDESRSVEDSPASPRDSPSQEFSIESALDMMESYAEDVKEERGDARDSSFSPQLAASSEEFVPSAKNLGNVQLTLPSLPKLLPKPNLILTRLPPEVLTNTTSNLLSSSHLKLVASPSISATSSLPPPPLNRRRNLLGPKDSSPPSKRRMLEEDFCWEDMKSDATEDDGDDDREEERDEVVLDDSTEEGDVGGGGTDGIFLNGQHDAGAAAATTTAVIDGKTIYLMQVQDVKESRRGDGGERKDIIVQMPPALTTTGRRVMPEVARKTLRPIKPATGISIQKRAAASTMAITPIKEKTRASEKSRYSPASSGSFVLGPWEMEALRNELDSPGGLDALRELLDYLKTVSIQENPVVKPDSDAESLALEPYTWNRIHFSTVEEWLSVIRILRTMGPAHLFANRDSLTYKLFSAIMRQFSRAVAHECPFFEEKGDNVNRFLTENFDKFMDTFPNFCNEPNANAIYDPRLRKNASSFRGIARKEVQKHYNEHLRNKMTGKLKTTSHVLIPVQNFWADDCGEDLMIDLG